jgi:hypothetical protein
VSLDGRPWGKGKNKEPLQVTFKAAPPEPKPYLDTRTNVLFANCVFAATQEEFRNAFAGFPGFFHATLCE